MSQYGLEYRLEWLQASVKDGSDNSDITGRQIRVSIFKSSFLIADEDTPQVIALTPTGEPLTVSIVNNDRDKFNTIYSKQAVIRFKSDLYADKWVATFCDYPDNEWYVEIVDFGTGNFIFKGFLMLSDMQQPFQPDPNIVELTASDHLGILKDFPLVDDDGNNPRGKYRIAELIAMSLKRTGLTLDIKVINNLRAGSGAMTVSSTSVGFDSASGYIGMGASFAGFFYPGQTIVVSGTTSNNGTFTVSSVVVNVITFVFVNESVTDETASNVTFQDSNSQGHIYDKCYLDALTFESEIDESEDPYTVLQKILGFDCFLVQWQGFWYIMRVDEFDNNSVFIASFDSDGSLDGIGGATSITKSVGRQEVVKFANGDTLLIPDRPYKSVRLNRNYRYPIESVCNIDFSRGDLDDDTDPLDITYEIACWTLRRNLPGNYDTPDFTALIHRIFDENAYETERYITLTPTASTESASTAVRYIESQAIPVQISDKFTVSIDYRLTHNEAGTASTRLMRAILAGDDGSYWILDHDGTGQDPVWRNTAGWTLFTGAGDYDVDFAVEGWQTISVEAPPLPVSGNLYIWLNQLNQDGSAFDDHDLQYSNLRFTYIPLINGTYQRYTGHYNKVTRATNPTKYNATIDDEVFIGEMPKPLFKGALFLLTGSAYTLAKNFYSSAQFSLGSPTDLTFLHPYGWFQVQAVWNQYRSNVRSFDGSVLGLGEAWPDMLYKYSLTDTNPSTNNRYFMLISFSQNWKNQLWTALFIECYRTDTGRVYTDTFEYKYIRDEQ